VGTPSGLCPGLRRRCGMSERIRVHGRRVRAGHAELGVGDFGWRVGRLFVFHGSCFAGRARHCDEVHAASADRRSRRLTPMQPHPLLARESVRM
jgi:hypothetical protein